MESEKVKEIKKALECCLNPELNCCNDCPYNNNGRLSCLESEMLKDVLILINELESENERLLAEKQKVLEYVKTDKYAKLKKEDMCWGYQMRIGMLEHEIDRQKDQIAEMQEDKEKWQRKAVNYYQRAKSYGIECIIDNDIDELLKEYEK